MWDQIKEAIADFFQDLREWFLDMMFVVFDAVLSVAAGIIDALPLPDFVADFTIGDYINADIMYFLSMSGFDTAMAIIGAAMTFRILRRFATLGIW